MRRTDSSEKTLVLRKIEGRRRRGQQRIRWLEGIPDSKDINFELALWVCLNSHPLSQWCHPTISSSATPFSYLQSFRVFSSESALCIRRPKYWSFSFSISPSNEYSGLIPLRLTGLISLQSKGLSRVFSSTTVQKYQFFSAQLSLRSNSHIHAQLLEKP